MRAIRVGREYRLRLDSDMGYGDRWGGLPSDREIVSSFEEQSDTTFNKIGIKNLKWRRKNESD